MTEEHVLGPRTEMFGDTLQYWSFPTSALQTSVWTWLTPCSEESAEGSRNTTVSSSCPSNSEFQGHSESESSCGSFTDDFSQIIDRALNTGVEKVNFVHLVVFPSGLPLLTPPLAPSTGQHHDFSNTFIYDKMPFKLLTFSSASASPLFTAN